MIRAALPSQICSSLQAVEFAAASFTEWLSPTSSKKDSAQRLLCKLVWMLEGGKIVEVDRQLFGRLGFPLSQLYLNLDEPDLAKVVLKKIAESQDARAASLKLWRENNWFPVHAALLSHQAKERDGGVGFWKEYVRYARTIGFDLAVQNQSGRTIEQLAPASEKAQWLELFAGTATAAVVDPWAN